MQNESGKRVQTIISYQLCTCRQDPFSGCLSRARPEVPWQLQSQQSSSRGLGAGSDPELHAESRGIKHQILAIPLFIFHLNMQEL